MLMSENPRDLREKKETNMTDAKLRAKVYEGVILDRQRAEIDKRLKELKADLIAEAKARSEELEDTGGGGKTIRFEGADGCIAVVTFPAGVKLVPAPSMADLSSEFDLVQREISYEWLIMCDV